MQGEGSWNGDRQQILKVVGTGREIFKSSKVEIVGISADPVEKQKEFVEKQKLTVRGA